MKNNRFDRQSFLGPHSEDILSRVRVGIIGLGGGGSHVVQQLAHLGIRNFVLYDPDIVEESNLNRLVGATADDARNATQKVDVAQRVIHALNPKAECVLMAIKWQDNDVSLRACDVIFGCVDSLVGREDIERFSRRFLIPYIDIGMDVYDDRTHFSITGQIVRSIPGEPCLWCLGILRKDNIASEATKYGAAGGRPQVVWSNGVLASTAVGLFIEMITPWKKPTRAVAYLEYDGNTGIVAPSGVLSETRDGECSHYSLGDLGDRFFKSETNKEL
jgi:hypothetical protein